MGKRSRARRAQRAWIVPLLLPYVRVLVERVQKARPRVAYRLAVNLGVIFHWIGFTRAIIRRNLQHACGRTLSASELRRFEAAYYRHFALLLVEFLRQPLLTAEGLDTAFSPQALERVRGIYGEGKGVIFVAGHAGLWELGNHVAALVGCKILSVAKLSGHEQLDAFVGSLREAGGAKIREVRGSLWALKKTLDRGEAVGINVDQEVRKGQVYAPFFGIRASTSTAPAMLQRYTGAPIVVATVLRVAPFRYELVILDEIRHEKTSDRDADVMAITTRINAAMELALRRCPEQWLWSHRRWRRRPEGEATPFERVDPSAVLKL